MDVLYKAHFGFAEAPFNITPDPGFLFLSDSHREALAQLSYGIKARKGFVVLTGEVGTGKTTLIHSLLHDLDDSTQTALVFSLVMNSLDLLRYTCEEFGLAEPNRPHGDVHDYLVLLNQYLLERYRRGENCALIIDEAQNLSPDVLEGIRLLSNFETSKDKLLQILLVGQPELAVRLNSQDLRQLKQRITLRHQLHALTNEECRRYVGKRLQIAGGDADIFTHDALEAIFLYSGGIPRIVNVLGDNGLLTAYALGKKRVDDSIIREVAADLSLSSVSSGRQLSKFASSDHRNGNRHAEIPRTPPNHPQMIVRSETALSNGKNPTNDGLSNNKVSTQFFAVLSEDLLEAMGPMASTVLQDHVRRLESSFEAFPSDKLGTLIDLVSQEILDPFSRARFCQTAFGRMRTLSSAQHEFRLEK